MNIEELCIGNDFIRLAFDKRLFVAKMIHQIDYKGTLFRYDSIAKIINECAFDLNAKDYTKY